MPPATVAACISLEVFFLLLVFSFRSFAQVLSRPGEIRSGPFSAGKHGKPSPVRVHPVQCGAEELHRAEVCAAGGEEHRVERAAPLPVAVGSDARRAEDYARAHHAPEGWHPAVPGVAAEEGGRVGLARWEVDCLSKRGFFSLFVSF